MRTVRLYQAVRKAWKDEVGRSSMETKGEFDQGVGKMKANVM